MAVHRCRSRILVSLVAIGVVGLPLSSFAKKKKKPETPPHAGASNDDSTTGPATAPADVPIDPSTEPAANPPEKAVPAYSVAFPIAPNLLVTAASALARPSTIEMLDSDGNSHKAEIVRVNAKIGLALVRLVDAKLAYAALGTTFEGGAVTCCAILKPNVFNPTIETIGGTAPAPGIGWQIKLEREPRLPGGAIIADGKVVGVQLGTQDDEQDTLGAATLNDLKSFLGNDLPIAAGSGDLTTDSMELIATPDP